MAKEKVKLEVYSENFLKMTMFLWLPIAAFINIIKKIREK